MDNEILKETVGYSDYYVSNLGNVYSRKFKKNHDWKKLKEITKIHGYLVVYISDKGKLHITFIHRLVALAFLPNPDNKPCVNHKDGNKQNNHVDNLEWCTYKENSIHAVLTKLHVSAVGERCALTKYTKETILEMRRLYDLGGVSMRKLGRIFGMSQRNACSILTRRTWKHI